MTTEPASRSQQIEAIVEQGRRTRRPIPRGMWLVALVLGAICVVGFVLLLVTRPPDPSTPRAPAQPDRSSGFLSGLAIGGAIGLVVGYAIARRQGSGSADGPTHSSRNSP